MESRKAIVNRETKETKISCTLNIDGNGTSHIESGIGFFDHMLEGFSKHGFFDLNLSCQGDLNVDGHHSVEDCGIVLGTAIKNALGDKKGIKRFGYFILPMDESLVMCSIDLSGRPYYVSDATFKNPMVGYFDTALVNEFFYSISYAAGMNLHFQVLRAGNDHHVIEAMFKAFAKALDQATNQDPRIIDVLSTKGAL